MSMLNSALSPMVSEMLAPKKPFGHRLAIAAAAVDVFWHPSWRAPSVCTWTIKNWRLLDCSVWWAEPVARSLVVRESRSQKPSILLDWEILVCTAGLNNICSAMFSKAWLETDLIKVCSSARHASHRRRGMAWPTAAHWLWSKRGSLDCLSGWSSSGITQVLSRGGKS